MERVSRRPDFHLIDALLTGFFFTSNKTSAGFDWLNRTEEHIPERIAKWEIHDTENHGLVNNIIVVALLSKF